MIANFRDLGGYIGNNGRVVKKGQIYRSSQLSNLSEEEINDLVALNMQTIVDFRNQTERKANPDDSVPRATYVSLDILSEASAASPDVTTMLNNLTQAETLMEDVYTSLVTSKSASAGYREFLDLLLTKEDTPLVFHCTFGKDRTGYGAALILKILGVSDQDILANYTESNDALKNFNQQLLNQLKQAYKLSNTQSQQLAPLLGVNPTYLKHVFQTITANYQDFDTYLEKELAFDQAKVTAFREKFLVNA